MNYRKTFNRIILIAWSTVAVIFLMCSIALNNAQAKFLFKVGIFYNTGDGPCSVAIGELYLVTGGGIVSGLLGNGDGSFQRLGPATESAVAKGADASGYMEIQVSRFSIKTRQYIPKSVYQKEEKSCL